MSININHQRMQSAVKTKISLIIHNEIQDPMLKYISLHDVSLSRDNHNAKIYYSFIGKADDKEKYIKLINRYALKIQHLLSKKINTYKSIKLTFIYDDLLKQSKPYWWNIKKIVILIFLILFELCS